MSELYEVDGTELIEKASEELKKIEAIKPPAWAIFVRTGQFKERPPVQNDWWYKRTASVLRKIAKVGPIGTSKLRTLYGGKKNRGVKTERFYKASGSILRKILQQLEKAEFVKQVQKGVHKGRTATPKGISFLDRIAREILKARPQQSPAETKPAAKPKVKTESKTGSKKEAGDKKAVSVKKETLPTAESLIGQTKEKFGEAKKKPDIPTVEELVQKTEQFAEKKPQ